MAQMFRRIARARRPGLPVVVDANLSPMLQDRIARLVDIEAGLATSSQVARDLKPGQKPPFTGDRFEVDNPGARLTPAERRRT